MILCCGESLIDMIPAVTAQGATAYVPHPGGAIFNTAVALGRLGLDVGLLSGVSTDAFGRLLSETLAANGVATQYLMRSDRLTTLALLQMENGSARYAFYDENSAGRGVTPAEVPSIGAAVEVLYFGGISLVEAPGADTYEGVLAGQGAARLVMLDPNIRPGFVRDAQVYRARLGRMIAAADIVKVSDEDLDWLVPGDLPSDRKAETLLAQGPRLVVLTQGADGAAAFWSAGRVGVAAPAAEVVDTVGAGDTFNAGFLAGLADGNCLSKAALGRITAETVRHALDLGARVAAVTVSRAGANPPWAQEVGR